jgi:hypothetical protein
MSSGFPITKEWLTRGLKHKDRLRKGQHMRTPLKQSGKYGRLNEAFRVKMLTRWFDEALGRGQLPQVDAAGWEWVMVDREAMPNEGTVGRIGRRVGVGGQMTWKGDGVCVGHLEGMGKDRRPDLRTAPDAVVPMSPALNRFMEAVAQKHVDEQEDEEA